MITAHKAQEMMLVTENPHVMTALETIVDLWRMFGEANCDAVELRDELDAIRAGVGRRDADAFGFTVSLIVPEHNLVAAE